MAGEFPAISEMVACGGASSLAGDATRGWALALSLIDSLNRIQIQSEASLTSARTFSGLLSWRVPYQPHDLESESSSCQFGNPLYEFMT
jgi:hypothetical protein